MAKWQTEQDEPASMIVEEDWDNMSVTERVSRAKEVGLDGVVGAKAWHDLTLLEVVIIRGQERPPMELGYQVKAHIILEDSDKQAWGITKDTEGDLEWKVGEGVLVGTWSRSPVDGLIHVFLESSVSALYDKATRTFADYAEKRRAAVVAPRIRSKTARAPKPAKEPEIDENLAKINKLRGLIGK